MSSRGKHLVLFSLLFAFRIFGRHTIEAYISYQAVPRERQLEWLKQMTTDFTDSKVGEMSKNQISTAPYLMYAWSHTPQKSIEKALALESLVKRLVDERRAGNHLVCDLSVSDYNCLLEGWARSGAGYAAAERCERILERMEEEGGPLQPDLSSYKAVLMAWRHVTTTSSSSSTTRSESKQQQQQLLLSSAHRAQRVLESMLRACHYNHQENKRFLPDSDCFDIVSQAWSRSGHAKAAEHAELVLAEMERVYESTGNPKVKPRTSSFNAVLAAWARSPHPKAASRACDLLSFMELLADEHGDVSVAPDNTSYCTVMGALVRQGRDPLITAVKVERLLRRVESRHKKNPTSIVPDTFLFNTAMGCWAKTNRPGSFRRVRSILDRQIQLHRSGFHECRPDVYGFTSVIASAASANNVNNKNSKDRNMAFLVATSSFQEMKNFGIHPNHVTYGNMLKACARLLSSSPATSARRKKWAHRIFEECRSSGFVGDMVLSQLRQAVPHEQYKEMLRGHTRSTLPTSWTAQLPPKSLDERKHRTNKRRTGEV